MKSLLCLPILTYIFFSTIKLNAQTLRDSVYNDVIEYNDQNTENIGTHYLTTLPVNEADKILILYNNAGIPDKLFFHPLSFNPDSKQFILISPRRERILSLPDGGHARTVPSIMFYYVRRENNQLLIDSLERREKLPRFLFQKTADLVSDAKLIYHEDCHGSECPVDSYKQLKPSTITEYLSFYQKDHGVIIRDIYISKDQNEKQNHLYFPLADLSSTDKIDFILGRYYSKIGDIHTAKLAPYPATIFSPKVINTEKLKPWTYMQ